jgi:hypothetical protein
MDQLLSNSFTTKVPLNIRLKDKTLKGFVAGNMLSPYSIFEVHLSGGDIFLIEAVPQQDYAGFYWSSLVKDELQKVVPLIGRIIERSYQHRKQLSH